MDPTVGWLTGFKIFQGSIARVALMKIIILGYSESIDI